jgi:hypothetical protein
LRRLFTIAIVLVALAAPVRAGAPYDLALPIDCEPGRSCWILRYVDHEPGPGARDYVCGRLTGDGHKGTDFAIRNLAAMIEGVEVRAAAPGMVDALRDGVEDVSVEDTGRDAVAGIQCGNGIRLDHGEGWKTWYCHLRRGSLRVKEGDHVEAGQPLALVGMSGEASFPHLHFDLRHEEEPVDPFVGLERSEDCSPGARPFWREDVLAGLAYEPLVVTDAGFATAPPKGEDIQAGYHDTAELPASSPALVMWVQAYWVEEGDRLRFRIEGPDGDTVVDHATIIERDRARWFGFAGERRPGEGWPAGTYRGEITLERPGSATPIRTSLKRDLAIR